MRLALSVLPPWHGLHVSGVASVQVELDAVLTAPPTAGRPGLAAILAAADALKVGPTRGCSLRPAPCTCL